MKIRILSDLHLEWDSIILASAGEDLLILAGDIATNTDAILAAQQMATALQVPIVQVAGNHEYYRQAGDGHTWESTPDDLRTAADHVSEIEPGKVTFLEDAVAIYRGIRFIGATLWTDMKLFFDDDPLTILAVTQKIHDYRAIIDGNQNLSPASTITRHYNSRRFITEALVQPFEGATVVVTHHAPSWLSVPENYRHDLCSAAYASRLETMIDHGKPQLWVHGHTHTSFDYKLYDTRVVCNPRGYRDENPNFDIKLVVEV